MYGLLELVGLGPCDPYRFLLGLGDLDCHLVGRELLWFLENPCGLLCLA